MLQAPRRRKYRKCHKMRIGKINFSKGGCQLKFGTYGLRVLKSVRLLPDQIEAARRMISRRIKKRSKIWIRAFPDIPISQKPKEVRMGKGKGAVEY
jgi:large subunit ribosomal protein L16